MAKFHCCTVKTEAYCAPCWCVYSDIIVSMHTPTVCITHFSFYSEWYQTTCWLIIMSTQNGLTTRSLIKHHKNHAVSEGCLFILLVYTRQQALKQAFANTCRLTMAKFHCCLVKSEAYCANCWCVYSDIIVSMHTPTVCVTHFSFYSEWFQTACWLIIMSTQNGLTLIITYN
jgi:hypothetical protein